MQIAYLTLSWLKALEFFGQGDLAAEIRVDLSHSAEGVWVILYQSGLKATSGCDARGWYEYCS